VYGDVEKSGQWVQKCMVVVRKCDMVAKYGWCVQKKHGGPVVVVKKTGDSSEKVESGCKNYRWW
jgi:hypothetical protein